MLAWRGKVNTCISALKELIPRHPLTSTAPLLLEAFHCLFHRLRRKHVPEGED
jgi:hypothetical protein